MGRGGIAALALVLAVAAGTWGVAAFTGDRRPPDPIVLDTGRQADQATWQELDDVDVDGSGGPEPSGDRTGTAGTSGADDSDVPAPGARGDSSGSGGGDSSGTARA
jgi:hypothetical protein